MFTRSLILGAIALALSARITSAFQVRMVSHFRSGVNTMKQAPSNIMAEPTYTHCLLELPKITVNDFRGIVRASSTTPQRKLEKGFKFYVSLYLCNFEGKFILAGRTAWLAITTSLL